MRIPTIRYVLTGLVAAATGCQMPAGWFQKADSTNTAGKDPSASAKEAADAPKAPLPTINAPTYYAAGQLHEREGNYPAASEQYFRATKSDPKYVAAYTRLGIVYDRMGAYEQAEAAFIRAISLAPQLAYLRNNLGFSFMLHGAYEPAERALREAILLKPDYHRAQMNLGVVLARTGRMEEAADAFARSVPRDAAYYNVGLLCTADRRFELAHEAFERALAINPNCREAQTQLERMRLAEQDAGGAQTAALVQATQMLVQNVGPIRPAAMVSGAQAGRAADADALLAPQDIPPATQPIAGLRDLDCDQTELGGSPALSPDRRDDPAGGP